MLYDCSKISNFARHLLSTNNIIQLVQGSNPNRSSEYLAYLVNDKQITISIFFGDRILYHELAHIIELNNLNRLTQTDFGFINFNYKNVSDKYYLAGFWREIKVRAIQDRIAERKPEYTNKNCYIRNFSWVQNAINRIQKNPIGKFKTNQDVIDNTNSYYLKVYNDYTFDKIEFEWQKRMKFLNNWKNS